MNNQVELKLGLFYGFHSKKLREIIGPMSGYLEFEKKIEGRRVDIFIEEEDHEVYIEMQIYDSDESHLNQVLKIIENDQLTDDTKIIWIATDFDLEHLRKVRTELNRSTKRLDFYAIKISENMVRKLESFAYVDDFVIFDRLACLNEYDDTKLFRKYTNEKELEDRVYSFRRLANKDDELIRYYCKEIRRQIPSWINGFKSKMLSARRIQFGGGVNDITFKIGIDRYNMLTVSIQFGHAQFGFFENLYKCKQIINDRLTPLPNWNFDKNNLSYGILFDENNKEVVLEKQVAVLKTYLEVFYPLTKNRDEIVATQSKSELEDLVDALLT